MDTEKVTQSGGTHSGLTRAPTLKYNNCACTQEEMVEADVDLVRREAAAPAEGRKGEESETT